MVDGQRNLELRGKSIEINETGIGSDAPLKIIVSSHLHISDNMHFEWQILCCQYIKQE